jgi:ribosome-associated heat shock protein Hsp15
MRVDKYLWCIRVYKSRTIAAEQCALGKVMIHDEPVKASRELKPGDAVTVRKGAIHFSYKVIDFPKMRVGAKLLDAYVENITSPEELKKLEMILLQQKQDRPRGLGRPTKKDRREIDYFFLTDDE